MFLESDFFGVVWGNFPFSGTEIYLFDLMRLMTDRGHEAALFSMADLRGNATKYDCHFVPNITFKSGDQTIWQKARLASHAVYSTDARRRLGRMIEDFRPDVAHVRNIYHHLSPSVLWELRKRRVPVLYHLNDFKMLCPNYNLVSRGDACERCKGGQFWHVVSENCYAGGRAAGAVLAVEAYVHRWLKTYEKCVDQFLVPSEFVRQKLVEHGWDKGRIDVLPHFQRCGETSPPPPPANAPILYFGRLSAEKGVTDLLHAMRTLAHIPLNVAGDGPMREDLEKLAARLQLENVRFLGQVDEQARDELIAQSRSRFFLPGHTKPSARQYWNRTHKRGRLSQPTSVHGVSLCERERRGFYIARGTLHNWPAPCHFSGNVPHWQGRWARLDISWFCASILQSITTDLYFLYTSGWQRGQSQPVERFFARL